MFFGISTLRSYGAGREFQAPVSINISSLRDWSSALHEMKVIELL